MSQSGCDGLAVGEAILFPTGDREKDAKMLGTALADELYRDRPPAENGVYVVEDIGGVNRKAVLRRAVAADAGRPKVLLGAIGRGAR